jgi:hypothetical protein
LIIRRPRDCGFFHYLRPVTLSVISDEGSLVLVIEENYGTRVDRTEKTVSG